MPDLCQKMQLTCIIQVQKEVSQKHNMPLISYNYEIKMQNKHDKRRFTVLNEIKCVKNFEDTHFFYSTILYLLKSFYYIFHILSYISYIVNWTESEGKLFAFCPFRFFRYIFIQLKVQKICEKKIEKVRTAWSWEKNKYKYLRQPMLSQTNEYF